MRRGLGTGMAANGVPVDTVAQVLGHKETESYKTVYIHRFAKLALLYS